MEDKKVNKTKTDNVKVKAYRIEVHLKEGRIECSYMGRNPDAVQHWWVNTVSFQF